MRRLLASVTLATAVAVSASGCGFNGIYSLPLPGAVANHGKTYTVNVQFADVLDLVPYSAVKVNGATVGHVSSVKYEAGHALVGCKIQASVHLPKNAIARVEQTSILGEKFVELESPTSTAPSGTLASGDTISLRSTNTDASVEQVLGALSALLNGGGVQQIHTIAKEVNTALAGRTGASRDLLQRLDTFAAGLNDQRHQILQAISGVDALARTVNAQEGQLVGALDSVPPALHVLADDRQQLTTMLTSVSHLGHVAVHVIHASQASLVKNLNNLRPALAKLASVGSVIPKTLGVIITYPTADSVEKEYFGDYGNLALTIDLSKQSLVTYLKALQLSSVTSPATANAAKPSATSHHAHKKQTSKKQRLKQKLQGLIKSLTHSVGSGDIRSLLGLTP